MSKLSVIVSYNLSLSHRDPQRLGCRPDAPPARARIRLASNGQPRPVRPPPVLPAPDHAGLPVWSRSAHNKHICNINPQIFTVEFKLCEVLPASCTDTFSNSPPVLLGLLHYTLCLIVCNALQSFFLERVHHCALTRNPVQPGDWAFTEAAWARRSTGHTIKASVIPGWLQSIRMEWGMEGGREGEEEGEEVWTTWSRLTISNIRPQPRDVSSCFKVWLIQMLLKTEIPAKRTILNDVTTTAAVEYFLTDVLSSGFAPVKYSYLFT